MRPAPKFGWKVPTLALALAMTVSSAWSAEQIIADEFSLKGLGRKAGNPLSGTTAEVGDVDWKGAANDASGIIFTDHGSVTAGSDKTANVSVEIPPGAREIKIEAELKVRETGWVGLALGGDKLDEGFFSPQGAYLFSILRPGGSYSVFGNAASQVRIVESKVAGLSTMDFCRMEMIYNVSDHTVTVRINERTVVESRNLADFGYTPGKIRRAGIRFQGPPLVARSPEVKNFKLTVIE